MKCFVLLFFFCISKISSQSYIIGDSQSFLLAKNCQNAKIYPSLAKSGIGIKDLIKMLQNSEIDPNAKNIFISIGVNDAYSDFGIENLVNNLFTTFPNAFFYIVKGSYGWGKVANISPGSSNYSNYYIKFKKSGVYVLKNLTIGFGDPHVDKPQYIQLGKYMDYIIYKSEEFHRKLTH